MRSFIVLLIAFAFMITGGLIVSAMHTVQVSEALAVCQIGLAVCSSIFGTILLFYFKGL